MDSPTNGGGRLAEPFTRILGHNWEFDRASLLAGRFAWFKGFGSVEHYSAVGLKTPPSLMFAQSAYSPDTTPDASEATSDVSPRADEADESAPAPADAVKTAVHHHQQTAVSHLQAVLSELCPPCKGFYEENGFLNPNESCPACVKRVEELNRKQDVVGGLVATPPPPPPPPAPCVKCKGKCLCFRCAYCSESFPTTFLLQKHTFVHCQDTTGGGDVGATPPPSDERASSDGAVGRQQQRPRVVVAAAQPAPAPALRPQIHHMTAPFACTVCPATFEASHQLDHHLASHKETYCSGCDRSYKYLDSSRHACRARHTCELCGAGFSTSYNLRMHLLKHSGALPYKCAQCDKSFSKPSELNRHGSVHSAERPYLCPECGMTFSSSTNLRNHKNTHAGLKPYPCGVCGKSFTRPADVKRHLLTHTGARPYACEICGLAFADGSNLKKHVATHSRGPSLAGSGGEADLHQQPTPGGGGHHHHHDIKTYQCTFCAKLFSRPSELKRHFFTHTNTRPFACEFCGLAFADSSNLKKHVLTHARQSEHRCYRCEKVFDTFAELESHIVTHKAVAPSANGTGLGGGRGSDPAGAGQQGHHPQQQQHNICVVCGAVFAHFSELQEHSMSHVVAVGGVASTTYRCEVCSKTFCQDIFLQRHLLTHTESRPYGCPECLKCFKSVSHLKNHSLTHGGEKTHVCPVCHKSFLKKSSLRRHENVHARHGVSGAGGEQDHAVGGPHGHAGIAVGPHHLDHAVLHQDQHKYHHQPPSQQRNSEDDDKQHHANMFQVTSLPHSAAGGSAEATV